VVVKILDTENICSRLDNLRTDEFRQTINKYVNYLLPLSLKNNFKLS